MTCSPVVMEHFQTDTADYADYLLPATTQLEHWDILKPYGHLYLALNRPAIAPLGESLPNSEIFRRLAPEHWGFQGRDRRFPSQGTTFQHPLQGPFPFRMANKNPPIPPTQWGPGGFQPFGESRGLALGTEGGGFRLGRGFGNPLGPRKAPFFPWAPFSGPPTGVFSPQRAPWEWGPKKLGPKKFLNPRPQGQKNWGPPEFGNWGFNPQFPPFFPRAPLGEPGPRPPKNLGGF